MNCTRVRFTNIQSKRMNSLKPLEYKEKSRTLDEIKNSGNGDPAGIRTPYKNPYKYCGSKDNSISCAISCAIYEIVKEIDLCKIQKQ